MSLQNSPHTPATHTSYADKNQGKLVKHWGWAEREQERKYLFHIIVSPPNEMNLITEGIKNYLKG